MSDEVIKRLKIAKLRAIKEIPLVAPLISKLRLVEAKGLRTLAMNYRKRAIYYDKEFVENIKDSDLLFFILHEIMHYVLLHDVDALKNKKYLYAFNLATDSVINYILLEKLSVKTSFEVVTFSTIRKLSKRLRKKRDGEFIKMTHIEIARELLKDINDFLNDLLSVIMMSMKSEEDEDTDINIINNKRGDNNENYNRSGDKSGRDKGKDECNDTESNSTESLESKDNNNKESESDSKRGCNNDSKSKNMEEGIGGGLESEKELDEKIDEVIRKHFDELSDSEVKSIRESIKEAIRKSKEISEFSEEDLRELKRDIEKGIIVQKDIEEKRRGTDSLGLLSILDIILRKKNRNWRKILRETFSEIKVIAKDYDYTRASRKVWILKREYGVNTFIPNIRKEGDEVNVIIGIDVSGSISDKEYKEFVNEVHSLATDVKIRGWIVLWEARVTKVIEMKNGWNKRILEELRERIGYGGTVIKSFFDKASELVRNRKKNTYIIVLTDGETEDVKKEWVKDWKKVVFITKSKESLRDVEEERNVEIAYYEV